MLRASDRTIVDPVLSVEDEDDDDDDDEPDLPEPVKVVEQVSTFDEMTIWGHDHTPSSDDSFAKGVEEWISFAEAIHGR